MENIVFLKPISNIELSKIKPYFSIFLHFSPFLREICLNNSRDALLHSSFEPIKIKI